MKRFSPKSPGQVETLAEELRQPFGLANSNGDLYVADDLAGKVLQVAAGDRRIAPRLVAHRLNSPQGMAFHDGLLLVVEAGAGRLLGVDPAGGGARTVGWALEGLPTGPQDFYDLTSWARASLAVDDTTAYVTGAFTGRVYRIPL